MESRELYVGSDTVWPASFARLSVSSSATMSEHLWRTHRRRSTGMCDVSTTKSGRREAWDLNSLQAASRVRRAPQTRQQRKRRRRRQTHSAKLVWTACCCARWPVRSVRAACAAHSLSVAYVRACYLSDVALALPFVSCRRRIPRSDRHSTADTRVPALSVRSAAVSDVSDVSQEGTATVMAPPSATRA